MIEIKSGDVFFRMGIVLSLIEILNKHNFLSDDEFVNGVLINNQWMCLQGTELTTHIVFEKNGNITLNEKKGSWFVKDKFIHISIENHKSYVFGIMVVSNNKAIVLARFFNDLDFNCKLLFCTHKAVNYDNHQKLVHLSQDDCIKLHDSIIRNFPFEFGVEKSGLSLKSFLYLSNLKIKDFEFKLTHLGIWVAYIGGRIQFYLSSDLNPDLVFNETDLVIKHCPEFGFIITRNINADIKTIKEIYIGLPDKLVDKVYWVEQKFRTNPLSKVPGGEDIVVEFNTGEVLAYNNIKYPSDYIKNIVTKRLKISSDSFNRYSIEDRIKVYKNHIISIYTRYVSFDETGTQINNEFIKKWDCHQDILPKF